MVVREIVHAKGHPNISAQHELTLEITKDPEVTPRGTCIIACRADKALADLREDFLRVLCRDDAIVIVRIRAGKYEDIVLCQGSSKLTPRSSSKMIIRKSTYIDDATLCIRANKAARDLDRRLVNLICTGSDVTVELYVLTLSELEKMEYTLDKSNSVER